MLWFILSGRHELALVTYFAALGAVRELRHAARLDAAPDRMPEG